MIITGTPVFQARRIEAGLLNAGSDFDSTTTPFPARLGDFVDFEKGDVCGRDALLEAPREILTWGKRVTDGIAQLGPVVHLDGRVVGRVCSSTWSPFQQCGVAFVRTNHPEYRPGTPVRVEAIDGRRLEGRLCNTPMYDAERLIARGKLVDIPAIPTP